MKKTIIMTWIALMSTQAFSADLRDASFNASSKASKYTMDKGEITLDETIKIADITAEKLKSLLSKSIQSTADASMNIGRAIVKVSEVSRPVFKITADGLAMVFKVSGQTADASLDVSKKLIILLDPSSKATGRVLSDIFEELSKGTEISSDVSSKILKELSKGTDVTSEVINKILEILGKVFEKPLDLSSDASDKIGELLIKGSETGTNVTNKVIGKENIEAGFKLTGDGISLTSKGISAAFYVITKGVTGLTQLFELHKEEIEKAVERNDQDTLAGLREIIRAEINKSIEGGEVINQLLSDEDIDQYIELRLEASAE